LFLFPLFTFLPTLLFPLSLFLFPFPSVPLFFPLSSLTLFVFYHHVHHCTTGYCTNDGFDWLELPCGLQRLQNISTQHCRRLQEWYVHRLYTIYLVYILIFNSVFFVPGIFWISLLHINILY
jgi:hypothetical protein